MQGGASPLLANLYLFLTSSDRLKAFSLIKARGGYAAPCKGACGALAFTESDKVLFLLIKETRFLLSSE